jgi:nicotinamidase-related amidase
VNLNNKLYSGIREANALLDGTKGAQFEDLLQPLASEVVVVKKRVSAHYGTELPLLLQTMHATEVVRAPVSSNVMAPILPALQQQESLAHTQQHEWRVHLSQASKGHVVWQRQLKSQRTPRFVCFAASKVRRVGMGERR